MKVTFTVSFPVMFSAQKLGVTVDALVLSKEDSRFLQVVARMITVQ